MQVSDYGVDLLERLGNQRKRNALSLLLACPFGTSPFSKDMGFKKKLVAFLIKYETSQAFVHSVN